MKKLLLAFMLCIGLTTIQAQTKPVVKEKAKVEGAKKADGTPDMRYKENKAAAKQEGPKKADGTPDMRYKENKTAAKPAAIKPAATKPATKKN